MPNVSLVLYRSLLKAVRKIRQESPHHLISTLIRNGVIRRNQSSLLASQLQQSICAPSPSGGRNIEQDIKKGFRTTPLPPMKDAFALLQKLNALQSTLTDLYETDAFSPLKRTPDIKFFVGQILSHSQYGLCVPYGWDHICLPLRVRSSDVSFASSDIDGLVDNRRLFVGIEGGSCSKDQPFYRVLCRDGTARYVAQESLFAVPIATRGGGMQHLNATEDGTHNGTASSSTAFTQPIIGSSFFFCDIDIHAGCYVPNDDLAARYADDYAIIELRRSDLSIAATSERET